MPHLDESHSQATLANCRSIRNKKVPIVLDGIATGEVRYQTLMEW
jgi:hypothetical protein